MALRVVVGGLFKGQRVLVVDDRFDLVLLDVMMPRLDGYEVLKRIRLNPATENLPVILLTAKRQDQDIFDGYHNGADMVLTKPMNVREIEMFIHGLR